MSNNNLAELKGQVIDVFEDFCDANNIKIKNPEKSSEETDAVIYGEDYDSIVEPVEELLAWRLEAFTAYTYRNVAIAWTAIQAADKFEQIVAQRGSVMLEPKDTCSLIVQVVEVFKKWCLFIDEEKIS